MGELQNAKPAAQNPIIIIPARMASTRLPGKPLADICGKPMVVRVLERALEADVGPVVVACAEAEIKEAVEAHGGRAVLSAPDLPSGSDRVFAALQAVDPEGLHDCVINLQGDLPLIDPAAIRAAMLALANAEVDIATLVSEIEVEAEKDDPNVVKAVLAIEAGEDVGRALYFSRARVPFGDGPLFHHIGIYAFRPEALKRFVALAPGVLESRERLEQLRALENGMIIAAARVDTVPFGVDTPADLERAREQISGKSQE